MKNKGNVLFLILVTVALFGALAFFGTRSAQGPAGSGATQQGMISTAKAGQCLATVDSAVAGLLMSGRCTSAQISYELPDGSIANDDAPVDGSCHVFRTTGGGATPCGPWINASGCSDVVLGTLTVGEKCRYGDIVYAGMVNGYRLYTTAADQGLSTWNDGSTNYTTTNTTNPNDGLANTNALIAQSGNPDGPYAAAETCRLLGAVWYFPSDSEVDQLYAVKDAGALAGTFQPTSYWSSRERSQANGHREDFGAGGSGQNPKDNLYRLRCVRR